MRANISPYKSDRLNIEGLTHEQLLALAVETGKELDWNITYLDSTGFIAHTDRSVFAWNALVSVKVFSDHIMIQSESYRDELWDWGRNNRLIDDYDATLEKIRPEYTLEQLDEEYKKLIPKFSEEHENIVILPNKTYNEKVMSYLGIFIPRKNYFVTPIIINSNILVYIVMVISGVDWVFPETSDLFNWGGSYRPSTVGGDWWRIVTCMFIHFGIFHLLLNMWALMFVGFLVEPIIGSRKFFTTYMLSGVCASLASLWWYDNMVSIGASGAIFGMYGAFIAMLTTKIIPKSRRAAFLPGMLAMIGYSALAGIKGGVDNAAHFGGLVSGFGLTYGFLYTKKFEQNPNAERNTIWGMIALVMLLVIFSVYSLRDDSAKFEGEIKKFSAYEERALKVYSLPMPDKKIQLIYLRDTGLKNWNRSKEVLLKLQAMDLPDRLVLRVESINEYVDMRIKAYKLMIKAIEKDTDGYDHQIEAYNQYIRTLINGMSE